MNRPRPDGLARPVAALRCDGARFSAAQAPLSSRGWTAKQTGCLPQRYIFQGRTAKQTGCLKTKISKVPAPTGRAAGAPKAGVLFPPPIDAARETRRINGHKAA